MSVGQLIDTLAEQLDIDPFNSGIQFVTTRHFDRSDAPVRGQERGPWAVEQGLSSYSAPLVPYPIVASQPVIIHQAIDTPTLASIVPALLQRYPSQHTVYVVSAANTLQALSLADLAQIVPQHAPCSLYLPALTPETALRDPEGPHWVVSRLLGPDGCHWDVQQTHQSLRAGLLEETYEVLEALDSGDMQALEEELGDLFLQTLFHAEMARQAGSFSLSDVYNHLSAKLINRHPHVFGQLTVDGEGTVLNNWEAIKAQELAAQGRARKSLLDGIPPALPALATAQKLCKKAARTGFDWPDLTALWGKLQEELGELEAELGQEANQERISEELGDVIFALANLARWQQIDAETALRETNLKFRKRFQAIEAYAAEHNQEFSELGVKKMIAIWNEAKAL
jgi:tetrapyrrole methylase family protein/MazG family protein